MIFFRNEVSSDNPDEINFEALENYISCGKCKLVLESDRAVVKTISFDRDKPYIAEGLIRSAFNYAALKNYYMGYCECENKDGILDAMNFEKRDDVYFNDIPAILQGNCCKKH